MNVQSFEVKLDIEGKTVWGKHHIEFVSDGDDSPKKVILESGAIEELKQVLLEKDVSKAFFIVSPCGVLQILSIPVEKILPNKEKDLPEFENNLIPHLEQLSILQSI